MPFSYVIVLSKTLSCISSSQYLQVICNTCQKQLESKQAVIIFQIFIVILVNCIDPDMTIRHLLRYNGK